MRRTEARELLMQLIFEMQAQKDMSEELINIYTDEAIGGDDNRDYFLTVCHAYVDNHKAIDEMIESTSNGWKLSRLGRVDLAILRLAVSEMKFVEDTLVPEAVAINEAVELAKKYGDEDSSKFVNGVLGKISKEA